MEPILNPYKNVDWGNDEHFQIVTHAHPYIDDIVDGESHFMRSYNNGMRGFAFTNYDFKTYPLNDFFDDVPADARGIPNSERTGMSGRPTTNIHISTPGSLKFPPQEDHPITSTMHQYVGSWQQFVIDVLSEPWDQLSNTLLQINHPTRTVAPTQADIPELVEWMNRFYDFRPKNNKLLEIYNQSSEDGDRIGEWSDEMWQECIKTGRQIFAVCNPDHNIRSTSFKGRNYLLLPNNATAKDFLTALAEGNFYCGLYDDGLGFQNISVEGLSINVEASNCNEIKFITDKGIEKTVTANTGDFDVPVENGEPRVFARIEIRNGDDNVMFSQPIFYREQIPDLDRKRKRQKVLLL